MTRIAYLIFGVLLLAGTGMADMRGWLISRPDRLQQRAALDPRQSRRLALALPGLAPLLRREVTHASHAPAANILAAVVFAVLGITVFVASFVIIDRLTPYTLWKEIIDEHNTALAILIGADLARHLDHHRRGDSLRRWEFGGLAGWPPTRQLPTSRLPTANVEPALAPALLASVLLIAACGLIYELVAGTLAQLPARRQRHAVLDGHRHVPVRHGHRRVALALRHARPRRPLHPRSS